MVQLDNDYAFERPRGRRTLGDLFEGRRQLIVYPSCSIRTGTRVARAAPSSSTIIAAALPHLAARDIALAVIPRAPIAKLERFR